MYTAIVRRILPPDLEGDLNRGRQLLAELQAAMNRFGATEQDQAALASSIRQLDELFLIVVVGEFNAGKSAFINALAGQTILREGVTPTTAQIHLLKYGAAVEHHIDADGVATLTAPIELFRDVSIVDTPGTNAIIREHERLTTDFVPRADLVLFVTSADRPFTESERAFVESIRAWGKKIVIVVNKVDIFATSQELDEVLTFVRSSAQHFFGFTPELFPVSARLAMRAKRGEPALWAASGFEALEGFITTTLDERGRFQLKLANPLGVGHALAARYATMAEERLTLLNEDMAVLEDIDRQRAVHREDLARGFDLRMTAVEKVLLDMEQRGHAFFEDTLRLGRVMDLLNRSRVQKEFEQRVVGDAPRQIERNVSELIDWLIDQDFRQWQAVTGVLSARSTDHRARMRGTPEVGTFHTDRTALIDSVGREAQRVVDTYDREREAAAIAEQARAAVTTAAAAGGAALGLGTIVALAASSAAADITGILLASVVALTGFLVIPARRRKAKREMQEKVSQLRARLAHALRVEFERARERGRTRIDDAIAPYSRFVRAERERWTDVKSRLTSLRDQAATFRSRLAA